MTEILNRYFLLVTGILVICLAAVFSAGCIQTYSPSPDELTAVPFYSPGYTTLVDCGDLTVDAYVRQYNETHYAKYGRVSLYAVEGEDVTLFFFNHPHFYDPPTVFQMTFVLYGERYDCVLTRIAYPYTDNMVLYMGQLTEDPKTQFTVLFGIDNKIHAEIPWKGKVIEIRSIQSMARYSTTYSSIEDFQKWVQQYEQYLHVAYLRDADEGRVYNSTAFPKTEVPLSLLSVSAVPPTAYVYLDGVFADPAIGRVIGNVPPGNHTIRVVKEGYKAVVGTIEVLENTNSTPLQFSVNLEKDYVNGSIALVDAFWADEISVGDRRFSGNDMFHSVWQEGENTHSGSHLYVTDLEPGLYTVRISRDDTKPALMENVSVAAGYVTYIDHLSSVGDTIYTDSARITYERV